MTDAETQKQALLALKKQVVASDVVLKDFNYLLKMPLDQSQVQHSTNAVLDHSLSRENTVFKRDVRAPLVEFTFDLQTDDQARKEGGNEISKSHKVEFSKVQLQEFFEELEKVQLKLDDLNN